MLRRTFCHIPGIGVKTERRLWQEGVLGWEYFAPPYPNGFSGPKIDRLRRFLDDSQDRLLRGDADYFARQLPATEQWRLFAPFREATGYLDIETTGSNGWDSHITAIALYDGKEVRHYVHDRNLHAFRDDIQECKLIVTYNGKCFDVPIIQQQLGIRMTQAHVDLRYILANLGYRGGLKGCEKQLGICRGELEGVDGFGAVLLWQEFVASGSEQALETLLAYNTLDAVNLEQLMVAACNMHTATLPFAAEERLPTPRIQPLPYRVDPATIEKVRQRCSSFLP